MKIFFQPGEATGVLQENGVLDLLSAGQEKELGAIHDDLARLYLLIRDRKPFCTLEFGSGYSTTVIAYALKQNWEKYRAANGDDPKYPQPAFVSVESSQFWAENTAERLKASGLGDFCTIHHSDAHIGEHQGQLCSFYETLPDIVPDFVYLDGPDPAAVKGSINGLTFQSPRRTVMAGDMLKYESTLLPGFFMIADGRTNNARFLYNNFKRKYKMEFHVEAGVSTFEMIEDRLGPKNIFGAEAYGGRA